MTNENKKLALEILNMPFDIGYDSKEHKFTAYSSDRIIAMKLAQALLDSIAENEKLKGELSTWELGSRGFP